MKHLYALFLVVALFMGCVTHAPAQTQAVDSNYAPSFELGKVNVPFTFDRGTGRLRVDSAINFSGIMRNGPTVATSVTIMAIATQASGTNFTTFGSQACDSLDLVNSSTVDIEYRRNAAGATMIIPAGGSRLIIGITNANQIQVRRVDLSNEVITLKAEAITL